jgi:hypothetical protein
MPSKFSLKEDLHHYTATFLHTADPILYILMDLGTEHSAVKVNGMPKAPAGHNKYLFGIHTTGVHENTFSCLKDELLQHASMRLLQNVIQKDRRRNALRYHDELCQSNKRFYYHDWSSRFPMVKLLKSKDKDVQDKSV